MLQKELSNSRSGAVYTGDAIVLYEYARRIKLMHIFEMRPGTSTNIICLAISELQSADPTYQPTSHVIEENEKLLKYHENTFVPELRPYVTLLHSATERRDYGKLGGAACYVSIPAEEFDFFFVDGPDFNKLNSDWSRDVLKLLPRFAKKIFIAFDGRSTTAKKNYSILRENGFILRRHSFGLDYAIGRD